MADRTLPWPADTRLVRLGEIEIDPRYRSVSRAGVMHELNPRCFELLLLFLTEPRVLHTRDAIFRKVWRGAVVEDANLTTSIWLLRRALGGGAKQWIRTISKQGYIFDPPTGLEFEVLAGDETLALTVTTGLAESDASLAGTAPRIADDGAVIAVDAMPPPRLATAARAAASITRGWALTLAAAACLSLMLLTGGLLGARSRDNAPTRVVLVVTTDTSLPEAQRWPARLLQRWLSWQLASTPRVELHSPSDVAADGSETVVLLELAAPAQGSDWRISAHFRGAVAQTPIVRRSDAKNLVAAIQSVSNDVFARLTAAESYTGPELALDMAAAQQLADALDAEQQHRWGDAVRAYTSVVTAVPAMGFARFRLARSLSQLGQRGAAQSELARAESWMDSLPEFLRAPLHAEGLLIRERYAEAAAAFAALQQARGRDNAEFRVAEATSLRLAGRSREAAERVGGELPLAPGVATGWLIEHAETAIANRDFRAANASATHALELAQTLGWEHERARAAFALVDALIHSRQPVDVALLTQAEQSFAATGDRIGLLDARVRIELERNDNVSGNTLDQLLAEARSAGNARVEIDVLRRVAWARFRAGAIHDAYQRLNQAAAVAESTGHLVERRRIDLSLLHFDMLRLDFAALDERLKVLDAEPKQGNTAFAIGLYRARLQYWRGDFDTALRTLESAESLLRDSAGGNLPQNTAVLSCTRAAIHIVQGRPADARTEYRACRSADEPAYNRLADIGEAELAIQAGDVAEARRLLAPLQTTPGDTQIEPNRLSLAMEIAPQFARIGDLAAASALVDETLPSAHRAGYTMVEANLRMTRAEIALAQGQPERAGQEAAIVERMLPPDYWYEQRRLRTVRALIAQARGDIGGAAEALNALHTDTRANGDVLGELLVHSLIDTNAAALPCPDERRLRLLAASGMRGASDLWMNPAGRDRARLVTAVESSDWHRH